MRRCGLRIARGARRRKPGVGSPEPFSRVNHDAAGEVVAEGTVEVPFTVLIPARVAARPAGSPPVRVMQFGHGFFGHRTEILGDIDEVADKWGYIVVAADGWGMADTDRGVLAESLGTDAKTARGFIDRVHQGMANFITLSEAVRTVLPSVPELQIGGETVLDGDLLFFYGISQGAILGGTFMALTPHISRAAFSVGGANFSLMVFRALHPFPRGHRRPHGQPARRAEVRGPPADHLRPDRPPHLRRLRARQPPRGRACPTPDPLSDGHRRRPDAQPRLTPLRPQPRAPAALPPLQSALVEYDFGISPLPGLTATPPSVTNEVHGGLHRLDRANEQLDAFFRNDGEVANACEGVCDPE